MLLLRPLYFMLAAITEYLDAMQQTLAVLLIVIAAKMLVSRGSVQEGMGGLILAVEMP
jgi:predicted tellurium resistance membrane protein TerC